ncbi:unnamed protein product [Polarella glacialis]|uniref:Carboxylic ester hydrolase n=1 Tax=Polarella glacialis TaxID=89957 RepID=A0A813EPR6_POLGL|nr:unnamed protein product [Polarella glacialis]CAE8710863.1 unnamed protein product [Polarella glacialis]
MAVPSRLALLATLFCGCHAGPVVELSHGEVEGVAEGSVGVWRGIPFAAPPVGDLRWRPPQEPSAWRPKRLDASNFRHNCYQKMDMGWPQPLDTQAEDCLYLNVYSPLERPAKPVPVMLWIYGGGFQGGGGNETRLNGTWDVALTNGGVVIVTFNYRLNLFGFAASDQLRSRDPLRSTGNYGILDQRQAMEWVQANIVAFGGDKSRVYIVGQSAGALSVSNHLVRPKSWGLFHAAGMASGAFYDAFNTRTVKDQEAAFRGVLAQGNCSSVACLLNLSERAIYELAEGGVWNPVVDGVDLTAPGVELAQSGKLAPVPVLVGSVMEDMTYLAPVNCDAAACEESDFRRWAAKQGFNESEVERVTRLYSDETERPVDAEHTKWYWAEAHAGADIWATCPARRVARWAENVGQKAFLYYWMHRPRNNPSFQNQAKHACETPFVFHVLAENPAEKAEDKGAYHIDASETDFSAAVAEYWISFAATSTPQGKVAWPHYTRAEPNVLVFGDDMHISVVSGLRASKCDFWDDHFVIPLKDRPESVFV